VELTKTHIDGLEGLVLEDDLYKLLILPQLGSKMASLVCKETGREVMWLNPDRPYRQPNYGDMYENYDVSGFDECFPGIAEGPYPQHPWKGITVPDHGELWTIPWDWEFSNGALHLWCSGLRFPYRFDKWLSRSGQSIHIRYRVTNPAPYEFKCFWAAHPIFAVRPNMRILLPDGIRVRVDWSKNSRLGPLCTEHPWPITTDASGEQADLSTILSDQAGFADKVYTTQLPEGWCALHDPENGDFVSFSFSPDEIPYVGVWINQGGWPLEGKACFNVALEPCTGYPDRLDIAVIRNECTSIPAGETLEWSVNLQAGRSDDVLSVLQQDM
jgi:galactose mutarotase-like enzyme